MVIKEFMTIGDCNGLPSVTATDGLHHFDYVKFSDIFLSALTKLQIPSHHITLMESPGGFETDAPREVLDEVCARVLEFFPIHHTID